MVPSVALHKINVGLEAKYEMLNGIPVLNNFHICMAESTSEVNLELIFKRIYRHLIKISFSTINGNMSKF